MSWIETALDQPELDDNMAWEESKRLHLTFGHGRGGIDLTDRSMSNVICICLINQTLLWSIRYNNRRLVLIAITREFLFQIAIFCEESKRIRYHRIEISLFFLLLVLSRAGWRVVTVVEDEIRRIFIHAALSDGNVYHLFCSSSQGTSGILIYISNSVAFELLTSPWNHLLTSLQPFDRWLAFQHHKSIYLSIVCSLLGIRLVSRSIVMNACNCFIISPRARSKRFLVSVISLRQSYDAVNGCSSDIYHLKLVEDKLEISHLTRRLEEEVEEEIVSYWNGSEMIRLAMDDLLVADFWRSLRSEPSLWKRVDRRDSSAKRLELIDKTKKRTNWRPNFISRNVVTTCNCLICVCTYDVSLASKSTPIWATTIITFLSFSFSSLLLSFVVLLSSVYTYRLNSIDSNMCVHVSLVFSGRTRLFFCSFVPFFVMCILIMQITVSCMIIVPVFKANHANWKLPPLYSE